MPTYAYRATNSKGQIRKGVLAAADEKDVGHVLGLSGFELIEAKVQQKTPRARLLPTQDITQPRIAFCEQMTDLLRAGLPFPSALQSCLEVMPDHALRVALDTIAHTVAHGTSVRAAFARHPAVFDSALVALLSLSEQNGDLAAAFEQGARFLKGQAETEAHLRRALRYPLFLLGVALSVTTFMLTMVVPPLVMFLRSLGTTLPMPTRLLIGASEMFARGWPYVLGLAGAGFVGLVLARRTTEALRESTDAWLLKIPALGPVLRRLSLSRFLRNLSVLVGGGTSLPESLRIAAATLGNHALTNATLRAGCRVEEGENLSRAMADVLPRSSCERLALAEQSGQLAKTLSTLAELYDRDARAASVQFLGALEPALTLFVGGLLIWIVLAVLGPVYGSLGALTAGAAP